MYAIVYINTYSQPLFYVSFLILLKWVTGGEAAGTPSAARVVLGQLPESEQSANAKKGTMDLQKRNGFEVKLAISANVVVRGDVGEGQGPRALSNRSGRARHDPDNGVAKGRGRGDGGLDP